AYSLPPGLPKDRLQTLRTAFMATMKDADFLAEAKKSNLVVSPLDGPTIEQTVAELYRAEPQLLERFREVIEVSQPERYPVAPARPVSVKLCRHLSSNKDIALLLSGIDDTVERS